MVTALVVDKVELVADRSEWVEGSLLALLDKLSMLQSLLTPE